MELFFAFMIWYAVGLVGSLICAYFCWIRNGLDVEFNDLPFFAATALAGPLNFILGLFFTIGAAISYICEKSKLNGRVFWRSNR